MESLLSMMRSYAEINDAANLSEEYNQSGSARAHSAVDSVLAAGDELRIITGQK